MVAQPRGGSDFPPDKKNGMAPTMGTFFLIKREGEANIEKAARTKAEQQCD